jgi:MoxR-like ATPase
MPEPSDPVHTPPSTLDWYIYKGTSATATVALPAAPPWRRRDAVPIEYDIPPADSDATFQPDANDIAMVNAAIYLRRPLLVTGPPGSGKSSLARSVAHELGLGRLLLWPINSRSTLQEGLYNYDALARLQDVSRASALNEANRSARSTAFRTSGARRGTAPGAKGASSIGRYLRLGALGTAILPRARPRVLLIDEIDKSDIDLPNDLLHVFERGSFEIPELTRAAAEQQPLSVMPADATCEIPLARGTIECREFPIVILTSNGEREFPPAFLRRCLRLDMAVPTLERLQRIVEAHFRAAEADDPSWKASVDALLARFLQLRDVEKETVATDQLLNALHFVRSRVDLLADVHKSVLDAVLRGLEVKSNG